MSKKKIKIKDMLVSKSALKDPGTKLVSEIKDMFGLK